MGRFSLLGEVLFSDAVDGACFGEPVAVVSVGLSVTEASKFSSPLP
jgi:hypothetical protein